MTLDAESRQAARELVSQAQHARHEEDKRLAREGHRLHAVATRSENASVHRRGIEAQLEKANKAAEHYGTEAERLRAELAALTRERNRLRGTATMRGQKVDRLEAEAKQLRKELRGEQAESKRLSRRLSHWAIQLNPGRYCGEGHELTAENTIVSARCRYCHNRRVREGRQA